MNLQPVTLEGDLVRLEPLAPHHVPGLWTAAQDPTIWRWLPLRVGSEAEVSPLVAFSSAAAAKGGMLSFAQILRASGEIMGSSSSVSQHEITRERGTQVTVEVNGIAHPPEDGTFAPGYYSVLFEDPDGIRVEVNYVPGKGHLGAGGRLGPGGLGPRDR